MLSLRKELLQCCSSRAPTTDVATNIAASETRLAVLEDLLLVLLMNVPLLTSSLPSCRQQKRQQHEG